MSLNRWWGCSRVQKVWINPHGMTLKDVATFFFLRYLSDIK
jgi:hypothetical protein